MSSLRLCLQSMLHPHLSLSTSRLLHWGLLLLHLSLCTLRLCLQLTLHQHLSLSTSRLRHAVPAPVVEFIATQFFSLSPASSETHFSIGRDTKGRRGIESPTSPLWRRRPADEARHVLDVQVEWVMRASAARLGYEWRRTERIEKQLVETSAAPQP